MSKETGIAVIVGICLLVLLIGIIKQKAELVVNFVVRMAVGAAAIVFCNQLFSKNGIDIMVGLNPWSLTTVGLLGAGGFTLLYGIMAYRLM
ncbi:pro-sigmaK processing inhibitor BofA family protein [Thermoguttaceae bacterium LCP21S3_D4]|jgi:inhibitor of the pro-sigma K processing machinery|nr:pro-sigmaK processing inhibitor BofA family protein [Lachnospiraceae bacterium]MDD6303781.1 pro-sigmaK processing inhibitor BofA family protein [Lachnospiraceae bacterium]HCJ75264.1 transcriptional regulator [Roseburia sp.]